MSLLLVLQVPVIYFVLGTTLDRLSHPTDGLTAFHVSFLSLDRSQNDSCLTVFLPEGKRVFHVLIVSLVRLGDGFASDRLSYGQASTYRPRPTYYLTVLVFVCLYVCTTIANLTPLLILLLSNLLPVILPITRYREISLPLKV